MPVDDDSNSDLVSLLYSPLYLSHSDKVDFNYKKKKNQATDCLLLMNFIGERIPKRSAKLFVIISYYTFLLLIRKVTFNKLCGYSI